MNVKQFLSGIFGNRNNSLNGEIQQAREAGEHHAEMLFGAYLDGFEDRAAKMLLSRQSRLIGFSPEPEPSGDIEGEIDYSGYSRVELIRLAKERSLSYPKTATKEDLIKLLS